jgi:hypothetical protein
VGSSSHLQVSFAILYAKNKPVEKQIKCCAVTPLERIHSVVYPERLFNIPE